MNVYKITPQGYCGGVKRAINTVNNLINEDIKPIYILGMIIHNKHIVNHFKNYGIITIDGKSRLEMLKKIDNGTIVITAHGASPKIFIEAKKKGLNIVDTTCQNVSNIHKRIKDMINKGFDIIYIGQSNHPETEGVLGIDDNIHFISKKEDINILDIKNNNIFLTNQTTLSQFDIVDIITKAKYKFPSLLIDNKICKATTKRQQAVMDMPEADLCYVVGDKMSSNTKHLLTIARSKMPSFLIEDVNDINDNDLNNATTINVTSGASTPEYITKKVIEYLKTK